jgi:hypothetical protein
MVTNNDTREKRGEYGHEAEIQFEKDLEGYSVKSTKLFENWTPFYDLLHGDYLVEEKIRVDVKRNSISKGSLNHFKGEYYAVYDHYLDECLILKPLEIKKEMKAYDFEVLRSGDPGIKFQTLKRFPYITLEEFKTILL